MAAFATLVASLAHAVGGGAPPGVLALALALAFSVPVAMVLSGERMSLPRASASALVAQAALHLLYAIGTGGAGPAASVGAHAAHAAGATPAIQLAGLTVDHGHAAAMPLAHVLAAAATVAMLAMYARAVSAVALAFGTLARGIRLLGSVLRGLPVPAAPGLTRPPVQAEVRANTSLLLLSSLRHRGPPVVSFAA